LEAITRLDLPLFNTRITTATAEAQHLCWAIQRICQPLVAARSAAPISIEEAEADPLARTLAFLTKVLEGQYLAKARPAVADALALAGTDWSPETIARWRRIQRDAPAEAPEPAAKAKGKGRYRPHQPAPAAAAAAQAPAPAANRRHRGPQQQPRQGPPAAAAPAAAIPRAAPVAANPRA
jgi:hypothetical protein